MSVNEAIVACQRVTKAYPGTLACREVSAAFFPREIHSILGENGAGKSTLVKLLAGLFTPDAGRLEVRGHAVRFSGPRDAQAHGIGVVYQNGSLIETMTVGENLSLSRSSGAERTAERLGVLADLEIPRDAVVADLGIRERRLVELHRLLSAGAEILVLDEPTAALSPQESAVLFQHLRALAARGCAIVVVSHKLPEVIEHSDRITVIRRGSVVGTFERPDIVPEQLIRLLTGGRDTGGRDSKALDRTELMNRKRPLVRLSDVSTKVSSAHEAPIIGLDLTLQAAEIVGIAGRRGSGASQILSALNSERPELKSGTIEWFSHGRRLGFVAGDHALAGIRQFRVDENLALRRRGLLGWRTALLGNEKLNSFARILIERFGVEPPDPSRRLAELSGGNVQRVLLARELDWAREMLLALNPTAGLDVAGADFVRAALKKKAASGTCVVVQSDDIDELVAIADRIVVISRGRKIAEISGDDMSTERVGQALAEMKSTREFVRAGITAGDLAPCAD